MHITCPPHQPDTTLKMLLMVMVNGTSHSLTHSALSRLFWKQQSFHLRCVWISVRCSVCVHNLNINQRQTTGSRTTCSSSSSIFSLVDWMDTACPTISVPSSAFSASHTLTLSISLQPAANLCKLSVSNHKWLFCSMAARELSCVCALF